MKHHFGDFLYRDGDYWTMVPNRDRYLYRLGGIRIADDEVKVVTIGKNEENWERIYQFTNLEELTLHEPSNEQMHGLAKLSQLKRLRVTHARPKEISFVSTLVNLEELVLEYVSGFSDLTPISSLPRIKSLHCENLRKVSDFGGLSGTESLRFIRIDGTLDWKQPIANFEFLRGLPNLEVLSFGGFINKTPYPAFLPAMSLKKLKQVHLPPNMVGTDEYALLEVGLPDVFGTDWGPLRTWSYHGNDEEWFEFTGKSAGRIKCSSPKAVHRCSEFTQQYNALKAKASEILARTD